jgi:hypothetical protein
MTWKLEIKGSRERERDMALFSACITLSLSLCLSLHYLSDKFVIIIIPFLTAKK